jgi:hypothetical protein
MSWAGICKRLRNPGIDFKESIPPAYVAWRAGTRNSVVVPARQAGNRFLGSFKGLQIRAQDSACTCECSLKFLKLPMERKNHGIYLDSTGNSATIFTAVFFVY